MNHVAVLSSVNDGRESFARRFFQQAYGTLNFVGHGSYSAGSYRSGSGALFGDMKAMPHCKPDFSYGIAGLRTKIAKDLVDPKKLPLIISVDPFINESNAYAHYIIPDSLMYESWGWVLAWNGVPTKAMGARWPVIEPKAAKTHEGRAIGMETFFIALAKAMQLPGFGEGAISDPDGASYKSALQNPYSIGATRLLGLHPENPVLIHPDDAHRLQLKMGDLAVIATPFGSLKARVMVHAGISKGVAAVEHGYGHRELGARAHRIGKVDQPQDQRLAAGAPAADFEHCREPVRVPTLLDKAFQPRGAKYRTLESR